MRKKAPRLIAILLSLAVAAGAVSDPPLTTADIIRFLGAGISERTMMIEYNHARTS